MKTNRKNRIVEANNRRSEIREAITRVDKKIAEFINFYISQIEKTYHN